jgi:hypothetical protein
MQFYLVVRCDRSRSLTTSLPTAFRIDDVSAQ